MPEYHRDVQSVSVSLGILVPYPSLPLDLGSKTEFYGPRKHFDHWGRTLGMKRVSDQRGERWKEETGFFLQWQRETIPGIDAHDLSSPVSLDFRAEV